MQRLPSQDLRLELRRPSSQLCTLPRLWVFIQPTPFTRNFQVALHQSFRRKSACPQDQGLDPEAVARLRSRSGASEQRLYCIED